MTIEYLKRDDLTRDEVDSLWNQGVCLDDWDYMLVIPSDDLRKLIDPVYLDEVEGEYEPCDWRLEGFLNGVCYNEWYKVEFRGEEVGMGVAYHA